jgi:hypothetical protein
MMLCRLQLKLAFYRMFYRNNDTQDVQDTVLELVIKLWFLRFRLDCPRRNANEREWVCVAGTVLS